MSEQENTQLVQRIYAAFGQGDIPVIMSLMAEDVEIRLPGPPEIPLAGTWHGHEGAGKFFQVIATTGEVQQFEPREFIAQGDNVVVLGHERVTAKPTGRSWETDWAMVWTVRDGKVALLREFHETAAIAEAFRSA